MRFLQFYQCRIYTHIVSYLTWYFKITKNISRILNIIGYVNVPSKYTTLHILTHCIIVAVENVIIFFSVLFINIQFSSNINIYFYVT